MFIFTPLFKTPEAAALAPALEHPSHKTAHLPHLFGASALQFSDFLAPSGACERAQLEATERAGADVRRQRKTWRGRYNDELRQRAKDLKAKGYSLQQIARLLDVGSPGTIRRWITKNGGECVNTTRRGRPRIISPRVEELIISYVIERNKEGVQPSSRKIAEHLQAIGEGADIRPKRIGELLRRHGISMKQRQQRLIGRYQADSGSPSEPSPRPSAPSTAEDGPHAPPSAAPLMRATDLAEACRPSAP